MFAGVTPECVCTNTYVDCYLHNVKLIFYDSFILFLKKRRNFFSCMYVHFLYIYFHSNVYKNLPLTIE